MSIVELAIIDGTVTRSKCMELNPLIYYLREILYIINKIRHEHALIIATVSSRTCTIKVQRFHFSTGPQGTWQCIKNIYKIILKKGVKKMLCNSTIQFGTNRNDKTNVD